MTEPIFNLYYLVETDRFGEQVIRGRAAICHQRDGSDVEKLKFLQMLCELDLDRAKRYPPPIGWTYIDRTGAKTPGLSWTSYAEMISPQFGDIGWFEDVFIEHSAPQDPMVLVTPVLDGRIKIDGERAVR